MREWLSGGALPCQGRGRGFESRLALFKRIRVFLILFLFRKSVKIQGIKNREAVYLQLPGQISRG